MEEQFREFLIESFGIKSFLMGINGSNSYFNQDIDDFTDNEEINDEKILN